jgi:hypothetical protein
MNLLARDDDDDRCGVAHADPTASRSGGCVAGLLDGQEVGVADLLWGRGARVPTALVYRARRALVQAGRRRYGGLRLLQVESRKAKGAGKGGCGAEAGHKQAAGTTKRVTGHRAGKARDEPESIEIFQVQA